MAKQMIVAADAREQLQAGIDLLARAVIMTLGPRGHALALDTPHGAPLITHDGVTIARAIQLADPFENMGAQLLKKPLSRPTTSPATAPPPPSCWRKRWSPKG
jgi:chaperonin GroEL